jgi:hypothetical protein
MFVVTAEREEVPVEAEQLQGLHSATKIVRVTGSPPSPPLPRIIDSTL